MISHRFDFVFKINRPTDDQLIDLLLIHLLSLFVFLPSKRKCSPLSKQEKTMKSFAVLPMIHKINSNRCVEIL